MLCELCKKRNADVLLKEVVNGEVKELNICKECAALQGDSFSADQAVMSFMDAVSSVAERRETRKEEVPVKLCAVCGHSNIDIKSSGRLGCDACYAEFWEELQPLLKSIQAGKRHLGKVPMSCGEESRRKREMMKMRSALQAAVELENYEEAARIRDRLKELEGETSAPREQETNEDERQ